MHHTKHDARRLRNYRRCRRRPDTPVKCADKQQIQHNVENRRKNQIIQGTPAVTQRIHNAAADIVQYHRQRAQKIIAEILHGIRHHLCICLHPSKEGRGKRNPRHRQYHPACNTKRQNRMNGTGNLLLVARSEKFGNHHAATHCRSHKKTYHQKNQRTRRSDRGKRVRPQKLAYNQRIRRIVKLLEHLTQENRQRKAQHQGVRIALRHILYMGSVSLTCISFGGFPSSVIFNAIPYAQHLQHTP